jgi:hypothetical protein
MLAMTDATLARIVRAASVIPYEQRKRWLRRIVARLEAPPPSSKALKQRRYRRRKFHTGEGFFRIGPLDVIGLENMLRAARQLAPGQDSRAAVEAAFTALAKVMIADHERNAA